MVVDPTPKRWNPTELCPCKSGWMVASCCGDESDESLRKRVPSLQPPGPITNFSHSNCYLRDTRDCSNRITREHVLSASILRQLGGVIVVSGMPWLAPGETMSLTVDNLAAKILCKRHNEALSPLDAEAGRFFSILEKLLIDFNQKRLLADPYTISSADRCRSSGCSKLQPELFSRSAQTMELNFRILTRLTLRKLGEPFLRIVGMIEADFILRVIPVRSRRLHQASASCHSPPNPQGLMPASEFTCWALSSTFTWTQLKEMRLLGLESPKDRA